MKNILEDIVNHKKHEVAAAKLSVPLEVLKKSKGLTHTPVSMAAAIQKGSGVIAEFKRASPSKGKIKEKANVEEIVISYEKAGASAISVLTDMEFFHGSEFDLELTRSVVSVPILRKDFIVDPYQIYEAKAFGADAVLLIAAILSKEQIVDFQHTAEGLGLEFIVEVHNDKDLQKLSGHEQIIGVNNRNLETFEVDIENSIRLANQLGDVVKVAESGLDTDTNLTALLDAGFKGFLVGESFMKEDDPGEACKHFINKIFAA